MLHDPMKDYDEVGKTFRKAADYIEEHGHAKGVYQKLDGSVCAVGALNIAIFGKIAEPQFAASDNNPIYYKCKFELSSKTGGIVNWNDHSGQTKDEVVKTFREIAEEHRLVKV